MAIVRPFKAIRPTRDKSHLVASRSYVSYSQDSLKDKINNNPYTFLHIINPDYNNKKKMYGKKKYKSVRMKFEEFLNKGVLKEDQKESFYIYSQRTQNNEFTGIIAASSIDDYLNNVIKIHEHTITRREKLFKEYLEHTQFNADPVLLTYPDNTKINNLVTSYCNKRAEYEFTTTNKVIHKLWIIDNINDINLIQSEFKGIKNIYIADGHHRSASSALLCQEIRKNQTKNKANENFNFFMTCLISENQLKIVSYNRLINHLNGLSVIEFIKKIGEVYTIQKIEEEIYKPNKQYEIAMYIDNSWYSLISKQTEYNTTVDNLDPSILSKKILNPILKIKDERTDKNISFIEGVTCLRDIKNKIDKKEFAVAFILKPIDIAHLKEVADNNEVMPPKSTYIQPKLRSGLTIYQIKE